MCQVDAQCSSNPQTTRLAAAPSRAGLNSLALTDLYRRLVVGSRSSHPFLNLSGHRKEGLLNVRGVLGGCLEEWDTEPVGKFLCEASASKLCICNASRHMRLRIDYDLPLRPCTRQLYCLTCRSCFPQGVY